MICGSQRRGIELDLDIVSVYDIGLERLTESSLRLRSQMILPKETVTNVWSRCTN